MDRSVARGSTRFAPIMMIVGAAAVLVGCVMPWFSLRADFSSFGGAAVQTTTANGLDTSDGTIFLVTAIAIALLGVVALVSTNRSTRVGVSAVAALGSLFVVGFAVYDAVTPKAQAIDEASKELGTGIGAAAVRRFIERLFDRGFIEIGVEPGLWIVIVGAAVALVGSLIAVVTARSAQQQPTGGPAPAPMGADQGWAAGMPATTPSDAPVSPDPTAPAPPVASATPGPTGSAPPPAPIVTPPPESPADPAHQNEDPAPGS
jgi:Tryptophan-associated transmembrane protein (Trp_oprn_chp)